MAASYQISSLLQCVFVRLHGVVTDEELVTAQRKMFADEGYQRDLPHLIHALSVTRLDLTADTVRQVAQAAESHGLRRAALVTSNDFIYGMMRMYEEYAGEIECLVSRDLEQALHWLLQEKEPKSA